MIAVVRPPGHHRGRADLPQRRRRRRQPGDADRADRGAARRRSQAAQDADRRPAGENAALADQARRRTSRPTQARRAQPRRLQADDRLRPVTGPGVRVDRRRRTRTATRASRCATPTSRCWSTGCGRPVPRRSRSTASGSTALSAIRNARRRDPGQHRPLTAAVRRLGHRRHPDLQADLLETTHRLRVLRAGRPARLRLRPWRMWTSCRCRPRASGQLRYVRQGTGRRHDRGIEEEPARDRRPRAARRRSCSGCSSSPTSRSGSSPTCPIAVVAALDAVFGGLRAYLDGIFDDKVFVVSFVSNVVIAAGDRLPRRPARGRRPAVDRRHRRARHPHLLQRRRHPAAPVPCLSHDRRPTRSPSRAAHAAGSGCCDALRRPTRGQVVVAVLLAVVGFAAVTQVRANERRRHLRRLPRAGPDRRPQRPGRHHPAGRGRDRPPRGDPRRPADDTQRASRPRSSRPAARPTRSTILAGTVPVTGPGIRVTITEDDRPGRHRHVARHRPGAAHRGRRGDADQRRGAGGRADRRSRTAPAASCRRQAASSRRTSST